jgi:VWFA-related protein
MRSTRLLLLLSALLLGTELLCAAGQAQSSPSDAQPIRVYSREVVVDVTVTDGTGNPVHGLKRDDFTVLEDGSPISPRSFREHSSDDQAPPSQAPPAAPLPVNTFTNSAPPEGVQPLVILLLDALDLPIATQAILQKQVVEFVDKLAPGTRTAVFSLSATGQLAMLQGFTADSQLLKKAVKNHKLDMQIPPLEDAGQDSAMDIPDMTADSLGKHAPPPPKAQSEKVDLSMECNHASARGAYTFAALKQIGRYVSGMPGRKNRLWFTGVFPERMKDRQGTSCYDFREDREVVDEQLGRSHIALYPIDPRALDILAKDGPRSRLGRLQAVEHLNMESFAQETNGKAFYNTNDLAGAASKAIDTGANYYTIAYTPTNQNWDTRRRTISVAVDKPGLNLVYKHAYHAVAPGTTLSGQPTEKATPVQTAMMRGALEPSEILFHVSAALAPATDSAVPPGNNPNAKWMKPPFRHVSLAYNIDLSGVQFDPTPEGNYHGQFEYIVDVYDAGNGNLLNSSDMAVRPNLPPAVYQSMINTGAKVRQEIDVPAKGDYVLRVGVHDLTTDRVGAVEIPVSAIKPGP